MDVQQQIKHFDDDLMPWLPQSGESVREYYAFERYLFLGPGRSYAETARLLKLSRNTISEYADEWCWEDRAYYYDKVQFELRSKDALLLAVNNRDKLRSIRSALSEQSCNALDQIALIMKDFSSACENPQILKKVKFLYYISRTVDKLLPLAQIPVEEQALNITSISDINFINSFTINDFVENFPKQDILTPENRIEIEKSRALPPLQNNNVPSPPKSSTVKSPSSVQKVSNIISKVEK